MFVKEILLQTDDVLALVVVDQVHRLNKKEHSILKVARLSIQFLLGTILVRFWLQYGSGSMIFMDLLIDKDPHQKLPENKGKIQTKLTYKCKISLHSFYSTYLVNIFLTFFCRFFTSWIRIQKVSHKADSCGYGSGSTSLFTYSTVRNSL